MRLREAIRRLRLVFPNQRTCLATASASQMRERRTSASGNSGRRPVTASDRRVRQLLYEPVCKPAASVAGGCQRARQVPPHFALSSSRTPKITITRFRL